MTEPLVETGIEDGTAVVRFIDYDTILYADLSQQGRDLSSTRLAWNNLIIDAGGAPFTQTACIALGQLKQMAAQRKGILVICTPQPEQQRTWLSADERPLATASTYDEARDRVKRGA